MRAYGLACARRNRAVISIFAVVFTLTFFIAFNYPKFFPFPVAGLAFVAIYVIATCNRWHRRHGVFCPHCGHSLVKIGEKLEEISTSAAIPDSLSCPHCQEIVAKNENA